MDNITFEIVKKEILAHLDREEVLCQAMNGFTDEQGKDVNHAITNLPSVKLRVQHMDLSKLEAILNKSKNRMRLRE